MIIIVLMIKGVCAWRFMDKRNSHKVILKSEKHHACRSMVVLSLIFVCLNYVFPKSQNKSLNLAFKFFE